MQILATGPVLAARLRLRLRVPAGQTEESV